MKYVFNTNKLYQILKDFHTIFHTSISVWDTDFNQILYYPKQMARICEKVKMNSVGKKKCLESDKNGFIKATKLKKPYTFTCHAGLVDTIVPVYHNGQLIAYLMFGQIRDTEQAYSSLENVKALCKKYNITEAEAEQYYNELTDLNIAQIKAIANFLDMCTSHLYISEIIKLEKNEFASGIDQYINENIKNELSVQELCQTFNISKTKLYEISNHFFNTSIKNYIIFKRLELAKHYLTTSQLSVAEISERVGYADYNYFIRIFKEKIGQTPLSYRKTFPFNLHDVPQSRTSSSRMD